MNHFLTLVRLNVFDPTLWAPVIAAATPHIGPFFAVFGTAIIIYELSFRHMTSLCEKACGALSCKIGSMI
jgi:hypothetical protein